MKKYEYYIGIDTGVNTGFAVWERENKRFLCALTYPIHTAMFVIRDLWVKENVIIRIEDARKRKWFGKSGREQLQGAGSIKRDAKIWEDFLTDLEIPFEMVAPMNNKTKLDSAKFKSLTGYNERTNVHGRDAAMLVFGF